jgi:hypothetical protein
MRDAIARGGALRLTEYDGFPSLVARCSWIQAFREAAPALSNIKRFITESLSKQGVAAAAAGTENQW